jgi:hypothetical protein
MAVARGPLLRLASALTLTLALGCATGREVDIAPTKQSSDPSCEPPQHANASRPLSVVVQPSDPTPFPVPFRELSE